MNAKFTNKKSALYLHFECEKKESISQYKGMTWHRKKRKWYVNIYLKDGKRKYGGQFKDELEAAKRVNQLCEELTIPLKNHGIDMNLVTQLLSFENYLITQSDSPKILNVNNDKFC